jgi:hypothetical protein
MNAQEIIDQANRPVWTKESLLARFYPKVYAQQQAELNLSKVTGK